MRIRIRAREEEKRLSYVCGLREREWWITLLEDHEKTIKRLRSLSKKINEPSSIPLTKGKNGTRQRPIDQQQC